MYEAWPHRVAVIGAGTMGLGVAECFAAAGIEVRLTDATPEMTREAKERLVQRARGHAEAGLLSAEAAGRAEAVEPADSAPEASSDAGLVFEAVFEDLDLKHEILAACSNAAPPDAVIVSNTSSLPIDDLAGAVERPERFLGVHWFNPPEWTPGVEVIPAAATDPEVVERVVRFLKDIGKRPAIVGERPRLRGEPYPERAVSGSAAGASRRDWPRRRRWTRWFGAASASGCRSSVRSRSPTWPGSTSTSASSRRSKKVSARGSRSQAYCVISWSEGRTGTKSGAGFLEYSDEERERLLIERDRRYAALNELLERLPPVEAGRE